jgi:tRNA(Arg) A34 adenosine deaminase TadA
MIDLHKPPESFGFMLPAWVNVFIDEWYSTQSSGAASVEGRMRFVIALANENVRRGTGGPFGAAVFNIASHELIAPGINCVLSSRCSVLHAEIVAIMLAQKKAGSYTLSREDLPQVELVTSIAPCAMCLGAIPWSGIKRLVCGGRDEDARAVGFDEGAKVDNWEKSLAVRGIETITDVCREEASAVLQKYRSQNGVIYNP